MNPKPNPNPGSRPDRRSLRLKGYDYSQAGGYFVTIVTFGREYLFGEIMDGMMQTNSLGKIAQECWGEIPNHFLNTTVDIFCVMPNHIHGILFIHDDAGRGTIYRAPTQPHRAPPIEAGQTERFGKPTIGSLPTIIRTFKAAVTRRAGRELNSANIWQRNYYEHILRSQADYERISAYIWENPTNWEQDSENPLALSQPGVKLP